MPALDANTIQQIKSLLSESKMAEALRVAERARPDNSILVGLKARFASLNQKELQGVISSEDATVEFNQLVADVVSWTSYPDITPGDDEQPALPSKEVVQLMTTQVKESLQFYYWMAGLVIAAGAGLFVFLWINLGLNPFGISSSLFVCSISGIPFYVIDKNKNKLDALEIYLTSANMTRVDVKFVNTMLLGKSADVSF